MKPFAKKPVAVTMEVSSRTVPGYSVTDIVETQQDAEESAFFFHDHLILKALEMEEKYTSPTVAN